VINYVGNQNYDADPNITNSLAKIPSYVAADVYASYKVKTFEAKFIVKNIGGNSYATTGGYDTVKGYYHYPTTPTTYFVTAKYNF
jgi:outer membrane receptor for ferrienterochelin and colicin